jgi:nucleotide-binding universal stress UspA family protein
MTSSDMAEDISDDGELAIVLAAVDTSNLASRVVDYAARLARRTWPHSQLHLVHVFRKSRYDRPALAGLNRDDMLDEAKNHLEYFLRSARRQCQSPVVGHLSEGDPVEEIRKVARSVSADLLITGTHDSAGLERFLLGSVAAKLARRAPCSVLIVRRKERPYTKLGPVAGRVSEE